MGNFKYDKDKINKIIDECGYKLIKIDSIGDEGKIIISSNEGYVIDTHVNNITRGSKPEFFHLKNQHTIYNINLWCKFTNKSYELLSCTYVNSRNDLEWKCLNCGEAFERSWNTTQKSLFDCPYCSGKRPTKCNNLMVVNSEIARQWDYEKNYPVCPEDVLPNTTTKYWWTCGVCNHGWKKSVHYRNQKNFSCPICKMSKGEYVIKCYLDDKNVSYHTEYSFNDCINSKKLRFDFYLPQYNTCIEYQGEFHYKSIKGISTDNMLITQKKCDTIKKKYCYENNINLIEIPYWEFKNIKSLLNDKIFAKNVTF